MTLHRATIRAALSGGRIALAAVILLLASSCVTFPGPHGPVRLEVPFWKQPPRPVDIVLLPPPPGGVYRSGGDEALHALITEERDRELTAFVETSQPDFEWMVDRFAELFAERGFPVGQLEADDLVVDDAYDGDFFGGYSDDPPYSVRPRASGIAATELLLVVVPGEWGVSRHYEFGAVPIGSHYASFGLLVELWDLPNRTKLWSGTSSGSAAVPRQWNEPPEHPKVRAALEKALNACGDGAVASLEKWNGANAELVYPAAAQTAK
jgi:hypothetical protein